MNAENIIKKRADSFASQYKGGRNAYGRNSSYKDELTLEMYNFYEPLDKLIFLYQVSKIIDEQLEQHLRTCSYKDTPESCPENVFYFEAKFFTEQEIKTLNPDFNYTILRPQVNSDLIKRNLVELQSFPSAAKLFHSAIDKLNEGRNERNLLDDLRLSIETLFKEVFQNSKSLENQLDTIGSYFKSKGVSKELTNMFRTMIDYFSKYQNEYVKHSDQVKKEEIDFIVNLSSAFIGFILNTK
jgi:hypothetical protein